MPANLEDEILIVDISTETGSYLRLIKNMGAPDFCAGGFRPGREDQVREFARTTDVNEHYP